MEKIFPR